MGKKYIIELEETPFIQHFKNGACETIYRVKGFNSLVFDWNGLQMLTPYTEPDLEQVRKEAYDKCMDEAEMSAYKLYSPKIDEAYQRGLSDAWEAARTLWNTPNRKEIFGHTTFNTVLTTLTAQEAIEKIRQYEQEKDRHARIEYNFDEIKDVLETTVKECNVSLDEIAAVLQKMREEWA